MGLAVGIVFLSHLEVKIWLGVFLLLFIFIFNFISNERLKNSIRTTKVKVHFQQSRQVS